LQNIGTRHELISCMNNSGDCVSLLPRRTTVHIHLLNVVLHDLAIRKNWFQLTLKEANWLMVSKRLQALFHSPVWNRLCRPQTTLQRSGLGISLLIQDSHSFEPRRRSKLPRSRNLLRRIGTRQGILFFRLAVQSMTRLARLFD